MWPFNRMKERALLVSEVDSAGDTATPTEKPVICADCGKLPDHRGSSWSLLNYYECPGCNKKSRGGSNTTEALANWNELNAEDRELLYKPLSPCPYCDEIPCLTMDDTGLMTLACDGLRHVCVSPLNGPLIATGRCASALKRKWDSEICRRKRMDIKLDRTLHQLMLADDSETGEEDDHDSKDS